MSQITISEEQLEELSRGELMTLVKMLLTEIKRLEARIEELEARSGGGPPATSRNSSLPPSRDQKKNLDEKKGINTCLT